MIKTIYSAPLTEQIEFFVEKNLLFSGGEATNAISNSSTDEATDYNNGNVIGW